MGDKKAKKDVAPAEPQVPAPFGGDMFRSMREQMDRFASEMFGGNWPGSLMRGFSNEPLDFASGFGAAAPRIDVHENDKAYTVTAELPGMAEDDVELTVRNGVLTLKGEKRYEKKEGGKDEARVIERRYGSFQRSFSLPDTVDEEKADAKFDKGVLTITLPKKPGAKADERRIRIQKV